MGSAAPNSFRQFITRRAWYIDASIAMETQDSLEMRRRALGISYTARTLDVNVKPSWVAWRDRAGQYAAAGMRPQTLAMIPRRPGGRKNNLGVPGSNSAALSALATVLVGDKRKCAPPLRSARTGEAFIDAPAGAAVLPQPVPAHCPDDLAQRVGSERACTHRHDERQSRPWHRPPRESPSDRPPRSAPLRNSATHWRPVLRQKRGAAADRAADVQASAESANAMAHGGNAMRTDGRGGRRGCPAVVRNL